MPGDYRDEIRAFAADIGPTGPVAVEGGRTRWHHGGDPSPDTRLVRAPAGITDYQPEEMTVRVGAGTTVAELHAALAQRGQRTALPERSGGTVGGALAVGESSLHRLGHGAVRDALLQADYVGSAGELVTAGGPTVKNVSGFDLCRMLVGSLGTLGLVAEVILRTRPVPATATWLRASSVEPWSLPRRLLTATSVLWDGTTTWVHLEGHDGDVDAQASALAPEGFVTAEGPPELPEHRWSLTPAGVRALDAARTGRFVAEVGVGTVHATEPPPPVPVEAGVARLDAAVRRQFDPTGRLNPGRARLAPAAT